MSRTLIAVPVGLLGFFLYIAAVLALADLVPAHWLPQTLFYLVAGLGWVPPTRWLMFWAAGLR
jgi:hypothetical protein